MQYYSILRLILSRRVPFAEASPMLYLCILCYVYYCVHQSGEIRNWFIYTYISSMSLFHSNDCAHYNAVYIFLLCSTSYISFFVVFINGTSESATELFAMLNIKYKLVFLYTYWMFFFHSLLLFLLLFCTQAHRNYFGSRAISLRWRRRWQRSEFHFASQNMVVANARISSKWKRGET